MKVTEEMILLTIQRRHKWLKDYVNSEPNDFIFISSVEKYLKRIKPLVDEMHSLLESYKKEQAEKP